jgi:hypothetical protein
MMILGEMEMQRDSQENSSYELVMLQGGQNQSRGGIAVMNKAWGLA